MIDTLVAFGCSITFGAEVMSTGVGRCTLCHDLFCKCSESTKYAYPSVLARILSLPYHFNYAKSGISNFEISLKAIKYILDNKPQHHKLFVVIGWTDDNRFTISLPDKNLDTVRLKPQKSPHSVLKLCSKNLFSELTKLEIMVKAVRKNIQDRSSLISMLANLLMIYYFETDLAYFMNAAVKYATISLLEHYRIPYLTIHTRPYHDHALYKLLPPSNNIMSYDAEGNHVFELLIEYKEMCAKSGVHLNVEGHKHLAQFLATHITHHKLLPTI